MAATAGFAGNFKQTIEFNIHPTSEIIRPPYLRACFSTTDFFDLAHCATLNKKQAGNSYKHGPKNWFLISDSYYYHPTYLDSCYSMFHMTTRSPEGNGKLVIDADITIKDHSPAAPEAVYSNCKVSWVPEASS
ncbi:hypothetical protein Lbir_2961 [Legionella birminghamensis]|uniref:Uncharacterized protein n=2 Tax=Legionella birminghamensis TaxID=28083 RepID=A0A378I816_9GAMM|nr:hypothetical protein Lbir_2961 [Legionella birminghamensis]STX30926.1 Uncharacterised protein [Legionella birminghamensis]